jgi:hypothetical protein
MGIGGVRAGRCGLGQVSGNPRRALSVAAATGGAAVGKKQCFVGRAPPLAASNVWAAGGAAALGLGAARNVPGRSAGSSHG